jgi:predicted Rossmann fold nucleotide-binding protein DprA/Smf involved in DNA uptake
MIPADDRRFPSALRDWLGPTCPRHLSFRGQLTLLERDPVALFCSRKCPGNLVLQTYDLAGQWRDRGVTVIGGFHSPMEQECLRILLKSPHPVILCPARSLPRRVPAEWKRPLAEGRLLLLSGFPASTHRATVQTAEKRNRVVAALAGGVFVAHAEPASHSEVLCREIIDRGKPLYTLSDDRNRNLLAMGAVDVDQLTTLANTPGLDRLGVS